MLNFIIKMDIYAKKTRVKNEKGAQKSWKNGCANAKKCAEYIKSFADKEKDKHNFVDEIGSMAGEYFLFFANMNLEEYKAQYLTLDEIFYGNTKGSVAHYRRYYNDEILDKLAEI